MIKIEKKYILKHKDIDVAALTVIPDRGILIDCSFINEMHLPFLEKSDKKALFQWWENRSIPNHRDGLPFLLRNSGVQSAKEYMVKNLALSLTDCYWICPCDLNLEWKDVSLFQNKGSELTFVDEEGQVYSNNASSTLGGQLEKLWTYEDVDKSWVLHKRSTFHDSQQTINEKFVTKLYDLQNISPLRYVHYDLLPMETGECGNIEFSSVCKLFTSENAELFSCYQILADHKKPNHQSYYEFYIERCVELGIPESEIRSQLELQIMMDYLITNTDRHFSNFGLLRNPDTLEFVGCAPVFDSGNGMFYDMAYPQSYRELTEIKTNSFLSTEHKQLGYIKNRSALDISKLPSSEDVIKFYTNHFISREKAAAIAGNYQKKRDLLQAFQQGHTVSVDLADRMDDDFQNSLKRAEKSKRNEQAETSIMEKLQKSKEGIQQKHNIENHSDRGLDLER